MDQEAPKTSELSSEKLAAAVKQLIELAVEFEKFNDLSLEDVDADIYEDLFDVEGTRKALTTIVDTLLEQREQRSTTVQAVRVARFIHQLRQVLPAKLDLPADAAERIKAASADAGLDLDEVKVAGVVDALQRQRGGAGGRGLRVFRVVAGDTLKERKLQSILGLFEALDAEDAGGAVASSTPAGKLKYPSQLHVGMYEGEGGTASLEYVLDVLGKGTPEAAARALAGWHEGLQAQLDRGLRESGLLKDE